MKIYKEKQFLIFDFEDGKTVKYDFATKTCIGKKGKPVNNLCTQLRGLTINQLCDCCVDEQYGKFLRFVKRNGAEYGAEISNIGTVLDRVPRFARFEQIFSAGIENIIDSNFSYGINDIPKALIKLCRGHNIKLSNQFLEFYKKNPDAYLLAYNLEYTSLNDTDIYKALSHEKEVRIQDNTNYWGYRNIKISVVDKIINEFGYNAKPLFVYLDYCKTYEAIEDMQFLLTEIYDYASMMSKISPKFDKYPRHFLTTHKIAVRNYNRLKEEFNEKEFKKRINKEMEKTFGQYCFIYPESTQAIKDEAVSQNNCVASYIKSVLNGDCDILFLRTKENPDKSLVTIEVRNGKIVQARQRFNDPVDSEQQEAIDKWNKWYANKINNKNNSNNEREE